jgi:hypothetical protein
MFIEASAWLDGLAGDRAALYVAGSSVNVPTVVAFR